MAQPISNVDHWSGDNRGRIATEFVIGGPSICNDDFQYDGTIVRCLPDGAYACTLVETDRIEMHLNSVGIEVCNFGYLKGWQDIRR